MELLLRSRMAIGAVVAALAIGWLPPLVAVLHVGTWRGAIFERLWTATAIFVVVVLWTGVSLTTQSWRTTTLIRLVIG